MLLFTPPQKLRGEGHFASGRAFCFLLGVASMALLEVLVPAFHRGALSNPAPLVGNARNSHPAIIEPSQHKAWGDFEYTKLPLEEPAEFLPDTSRPLGAPRWFFANRTREQVAAFFGASSLTAEQKQILLRPKHWQVTTNGVYLFPPSQVVLEMSRSAREQIYAVLAESPVNSAQCHPFRFRPDGLEDWFADIGLGTEPLALIRKLIYRQGGSLCFSDGTIVQGLLSTNDFNRLVKALYGERTFLMALRITPETDIDALIRYWGRGGYAQALRPLLEAMAQVPGGARVNISYLLPAFARMRPYTYANPADDPASASENCFWTALNFFNKTPDNRFLDPAYVQRVLAEDYEQISGPPVYGDLILVRDGYGAPIHMCVYLADDVVFTKNGRDYIEPWVLMKIPDMLAWYKAKQSTQVLIFRSRKG